MKSMLLNGTPPHRRHENRLPPGSGLAIAAALSALIWAGIAVMVLLR